MVPRVDQGECGSCYAHATSSMLAERICVQERILALKHGKHKSAEALSPNYIMSCDPYAYGCNGGMIAQVIEFLEEEAIPTSQCVGGYHNFSLEECPKKCVDGKHPAAGVKCAKRTKV